MSNCYHDICKFYKQVFIIVCNLTFAAAASERVPAAPHPGQFLRWADILRGDVLWHPAVAVTLIYQMTKDDVNHCTCHSFSNFLIQSSLLWFYEYFLFWVKSTFLFLTSLDENRQWFENCPNWSLLASNMWHHLETSLNSVCHAFISISFKMASEFSSVLFFSRRIM